jgi:arylsulfatase A-like enzyme
VLDAVMNILLITADQWRGDCLGTLGHPCVRTPVLDRLAADSILFRRHYGQATPCGPARASLLTGLYACNHRSITNGTPLDARHRTLATELGRAGYDCVLFGYTDTSADPRVTPPDSPWLRTFEGVAPGFRIGLRLPDHVEPWLEHLAQRGYGRLLREEVHNGPLGAPARFRAEDSETAFLADRFLDWLEGAPAGPWLAHLTFLRPHPPLIAAEPWNSLVPPSATPPAARATSPDEEAKLHPWLAAHLDRPYPLDFRRQGVNRPADLDTATLATLRALYFGLVSEVDHHIGRVHGALARRDLLDRTLIVVTSDHGEMLGDHWMLGKSGFFPQAFHVPLIIRVPAGPRGRVVGAFTEHVDLMPTLLEAVGLPILRQCDGRSLGSFLNGEEPSSWRRAAHYEHDFRDVAGRGYETALGLGSDDCQIAARLDGDHLHVHFAALPPLLFDLARDPFCQRNIASDPGSTATMLAQAQAMLSWRMQANERRLTGCALTADGVVGAYDPA